MRVVAVLWGQRHVRPVQWRTCAQASPAFLPPDAEAADLVYAGEADGFLE